MSGSWHVAETLRAALKAFYHPIWGPLMDRQEKHHGTMQSIGAMREAAAHLSAVGRNLGHSSASPSADPVLSDVLQATDAAGDFGSWSKN